MHTRFSDVATRLVANGYTIGPAHIGSKRPAIRGWQRTTKNWFTPEKLARLVAQYPDHGVFCNCHGLVGIDIDVEDISLVALLTAACTTIIGPPVVVRIGKAPRCLILYRTDETLRTQKLPGLEVRAQGAGVMLFGIHPGTRKPYYYNGLTPLDVPVVELPLATSLAIDLFVQAVASILGYKLNPLLNATALPPVAPTRMTDGREQFVRDQVWQLYRRGWYDEAAISSEVFARLTREADLSRPHSSGAKYDLAFVRARVASTLRSAKPIFTKGPRPAHEAVALTEADRESFRHRINAAGVIGQLRPASVLVSHAMLGSIGIANSAYVSTTTLAHRTGLAADTVKRARRQLREMGMWVAVDDAGGRAKIAHYLPVIERGDDDRE